MGRILAIDYGQKRVGLAVSDPLKIIANGMGTVTTKDIFGYLDDYLAKEDVETIVVGYPKQMNNSLSQSIEFIGPFIRKLKQKYDRIVIELMDERFTSKMAVQAMVLGGMKKKDRQNKAIVDKISAVILLQSYLDAKKKHK